MAIDFPSSPATNDVYTVGSRSWKFNGYGWAAYTESFGPTGPTGPTGSSGTNGATGATGSTGPTANIDDLTIMTIMCAY